MKIRVFGKEDNPDKIFWDELEFACTQNYRFVLNNDPTSQKVRDFLWERKYYNFSTDEDFVSSNNTEYGFTYLWE